MNGLGDKEKKLWAEIEPILDDLLDELAKKGLIETVYVKSELDKLRAALKKVEDIGYAHNALLDLFDKENPIDFLNATSKFGFTESKVIYMYIACAVTVAVLDTELFKFRLLFHMRNVSFDVSQFSRTISAAAPRTWPLLKPHIDNEFRNALAHGTYAIVDKKVTLFENAKLLPSGDPDAEMSLDRFMMRVKDCNVLYACLTSILDRKISEGFFKVN